MENSTFLIGATSWKLSSCWNEITRAPWEIQLFCCSSRSLVSCRNAVCHFLTKDSNWPLMMLRTYLRWLLFASHSIISLWFIKREAWLHPYSFMAALSSIRQKMKGILERRWKVGESCLSLPLHELSQIQGSKESSPWAGVGVCLCCEETQRDGVN